MGKAPPLPKPPSRPLPPGLAKSCDDDVPLPPLPLPLLGAPAPIAAKARRVEARELGGAANEPEPSGGVPATAVAPPAAAAAAAARLAMRPDRCRVMPPTVCSLTSGCSCEPLPLPSPSSWSPSSSSWLLARAMCDRPVPPVPPVLRSAAPPVPDADAEVDSSESVSSLPAAAAPRAPAGRDDALTGRLRFSIPPPAATSGSSSLYSAPDAVGGTAGGAEPATHAGPCSCASSSVAVSWRCTAREPVARPAMASTGSATSTTAEKRGVGRGASAKHHFDQ